MISCQSGLPRAESKGWPLAVPKTGSGVSSLSRTMSFTRAIFDGCGDGEAVPSGVEGETEGDGLGDGSMTPSEVEGLASGEGLGGAVILR